MTRLLELALHALVVVELAVDHDVQALVLAGDRLIAGVQIDDAQPRVPETDTAMRGDPLPVPIRPAMVEAPRRAFQPLRVDRFAAGHERDDSAHCARSYNRRRGRAQRLRRVPSGPLASADGRSLREQPAVRVLRERGTQAPAVRYGRAVGW